LPAPPQIFHGRKTELRDVIDILTQYTPARIAILGPGGMGKTALATAALHHPEVIKKYTERHFISCHATATCQDLISVLADHLGVERGRHLARRIARFLKYAPPTLLVLDNFETPWEANETRSEVEEFLSTMTAAAHVALLITMRGAERPAKVKWTRPFLLPLRPLEDAAARQMFIAIADDRHEQSLVTQVLKLTGNLPLAVSLIASVVSHEGCEKTLSRWHAEKTRLLSDGYDKGSSLEISLMVSLTSSRMTPEAQELLNLLSILPDGLSQAEVLHSKLPISNVLAAKSTLIQTSLAYVDLGKTLSVLPPIREYVRGVYPPSPALKAALRQHY
ncbi:P-loop containing nucleoside triphosphate hydrolase protein, partial [Mycena rosella]